MFQTFEDLESVKDKQADIKLTRQLLNAEKQDRPTSNNHNMPID